MLDARLKQRAIALRDLLLERAHFDEAHWLDVAVHSPGLCDSAYANDALRSSALLAIQFGLMDVAHWIDSVSLTPSTEGRTV